MLDLLKERAQLPLIGLELGAFLQRHWFSSTVPRVNSFALSLRLNDHRPLRD